MPNADFQTCPERSRGIENRKPKTENHVGVLVAVLQFLFGLFELLKLPSMHDSGGLSHTIDDGDSFKMVVLVLQCPGVESFGLVGEFVAVEVGRGHFAFLVSSNLRIDTRHRKAAFVNPFEFADRVYCRIHVRFYIFSAAVQRDNKQPQRDARLRSSQTDALVFKHDIDHLIHQAKDIVIDFFDRGGPPTQNTGRVMCNPTFIKIYQFPYPASARHKRPFVVSQLVVGNYIHSSCLTLYIVEFVAFECIAEIRLYDNFVFDDLSGRACSYDSAVVDDVGLIDDLKRPFDIMVCNEDAHA